jgi:hypothetical protein
MKEKTRDLKKLIQLYGYWSEEVKEFNSSLSYEEMKRINNKVLAEIIITEH